MTTTLRNSFPILNPQTESASSLVVTDDLLHGRQVIIDGKPVYSGKIFKAPPSLRNYAQLGTSSPKTNSAADLMRDETKLNKLISLAEYLETGGYFTDFDKSEIRKITRLSSTSPLPHLSEKGFGQNATAKIPAQTVHEVIKWMASKLGNEPVSMSGISLVRNSNTGWPFFLPGNSIANSYNNLVNAALSFSGLAPADAVNLLRSASGHEIPPCSTTFLRMSASAKNIRVYSFVTAFGRMTAESSSTVKGKYARPRAVYANFGYINARGRQTMLVLKKMIRLINGLDLLTPDQTCAHMNLFKRVRSEDISGFDLSVTLQLIQDVYEAFSQVSGVDREYLEYALECYTQHILTPSLVKGHVVANERSGMIGSGDILTSILGTVINFIRQVETIRLLTSKSVTSIMSDFDSKKWGTATWGDDTNVMTNSDMPLPGDKEWNEANESIGFKVDAEKDTMFLMRNYNQRLKMVSFSPLARMMLQTGCRESPYAGEASALSGFFHRSTNSLGAPGFDICFEGLGEILGFKGTYQHLKAFIGSKTFRNKLADEIKTPTGKAWYLDFIRGVTRGNLDDNAYHYDTRILAMLGLGQPDSALVTYNLGGKVELTPIKELLALIRKHAMEGEPFDEKRAKQLALKIPLQTNG